MILFVFHPHIGLIIYVEINGDKGRMREMERGRREGGKEGEGREGGSDREPVSFLKVGA